MQGIWEFSIFSLDFFFFCKSMTVLILKVYLKIYSLLQLENEVMHINTLHNVLHITDAK